MTTKFRNPKFHNAVHRIPQAVPPIWLMRQAGRYHSHYQALRKKHTFMELCKNPRLAAEVAIGPMEAFDFDVSIMFSDLLFPLEALGFPLSYDNGPPELGWVLSEELFSKFRPAHEAIQHLAFQAEALRLTRERLAPDKSLIGFIGSPLTLFSYAAGATEAERAKGFEERGELIPKFLERMVPLLIKNVELQLSGGAELVMIFDSHAGGFPWSVMSTSGVQSLRPLAERFPGKIGYYGRHLNADQLLFIREQLPTLAGIGADSEIVLPSFIGLPKTGFVQGNFSNQLLAASPKDFEEGFSRFLHSFDGKPDSMLAGWVCGLNHGVIPKTPEEHVRTFVTTVRKHFAGRSVVLGEESKKGNSHEYAA